MKSDFNLLGGAMHKLLLAALAGAGMLLAQVITGSITGTVTDASGGRVPGAKITATNIETGRNFTTETTGEGVYSLPSVPGGNYSIRADAPGFKTYLRQGLVLGTDQALRVDVNLEVGATGEAVTVTAEAPLLNQDEATIASRFNPNQMENLPIGRNITSALRVIPGVVPNPSGFSNTFADGNINGGRATTTNYMIDGTAAVNTNLTQATYQPILEATEEMTIQTSNYGAQLGRGGAAINITTRAGTNDWHGSLFHFFQNDKLNANDFFNNATGKQRPPQRYNLFGGTISGPVLLPRIYNGRNKSFFTFAYEGTRQAASSNIISTVPTEAIRNGNFAGLATIFDPTTVRREANGSLSAIAFPNNVVPANRIDARSKAILEHVPLPNQPGSVNNYAYLVPTPNNQNAINTRFDHNWTDNMRTTVRYGQRKQDVYSAVSWDGPAGAGSTAISRYNPNTYHNLTAAHTTVLSPTVVNDFNFGYFYTHTQQNPPGAREGWAEKLGFGGVQSDLFPLVSISTFAGIGGGNMSNVYPARNYDITDMVSILKGSHSLKIGGQYRTLVFFDDRGTGLTFSFDSQGTFNPATAQTRGSTGHPLASFLLGYPSNSSWDVRAPGGFRFRQKYFAGYFQDDWRVSSRLTLNLGIRWETTTPRTEDNDLQTVFNLNTLQMDVAGKNGYPRTLRDTDYMNFQPRFGFAFTLRPTTVLRGGYGIFMLQTEVSGNTFTSPGPAQRAVSYPASGIDNQFPVTFGTFASAMSKPDLSAPMVVNANTGVNWMPREYPTAYQQQWNFNIQQQLPWNILAETGYVGNRGLHLEFNRNLNTIPIERLNAPGYPNAQARRPYPTVGAITSVRNDPIGSSTYHSLQARLQKRLSSGVSFNVAYTFSKAIDDASDVLAFRQVGVNGVQNHYNLRAERSISTFDRTHNLSFDTIWQLPFGKGRALMNRGGAVDAVLGGWNLSTITAVYSGLPLALSVANANAITNTMGGSLRPNRLREGALPESERSLQRWFDASAYAAPAAGTFGNTSRTEPNVRGPGLWNVDFLLAKQFRITEKLQLNLRSEFFNALNHFNPGTPATQIGNAAVGTIRSAQNNARTVQLSMRLSF